MPTSVSLWGPFVLAAGAGCALALAELLSTFQRELGIALRNRWSWALIGLNATAAVGVYLIVGHLTPGSTNPLVTAGIVGITFPAIIRSRFTFYRNPGAGENGTATELALRLDAMYTSVQQSCYTEVNMVVADRLHSWASAISGSDFDLVRHLPELIAAGRLPDRRAEYEQRYQDILSKFTGHSEKQRYRLALLYIDMVPRAALQRRLHELEGSMLRGPAVQAVGDPQGG